MNTTTTKKPIAVAHANGLRISPRKMRLVTNMVKNMFAEDALAQLEFTPKRAAKQVKDIIVSAIANATTTFGMKRENLYISELTVDSGMKLKRFMPRAQGKAGAIRRPTSHMHIVLEERANRRKRRNVFAQKAVQSNLKKDTTVIEDRPEAEEKARIVRDQVGKTNEQTKANKVTQKRRLFNRKSGV